MMGLDKDVLRLEPFCMIHERENWYTPFGTHHSRPEKSTIIYAYSFEAKVKYAADIYPHTLTHTHTQSPVVLWELPGSGVRFEGSSVAGQQESLPPSGGRRQRCL